MARTEEWTDLVERVGLMADSADNYLAATQLPLPLQMHVGGLKIGMEDLRDQLIALYRDLGGREPVGGQELEEDDG